MKKQLKIKVCGMTDPVNINDLVLLKPDYIGFNYYPPSPRYIIEKTPAKTLFNIPGDIIITGVFVNTETAVIKKIIKTYKLSAVQLHGQENPDFCKKISTNDILLIKAFHVAEKFNFAELQPYLDVCDYFLFDTKTKGYGGSGRKFNWNIFKDYPFDKPFFLSGGIGPEDAEEIKKIRHPAFFGVDINSRFELFPGFKDIERIKNFIHQIKEEI